jgi:extradiol dioxygenase
VDILGLGYLGLESPNAKLWREYGPEVLGMGLNEEGQNGDTVLLTMDDRHHRIAVRPGDTDRLAYLGWETRDRFAFEDGVDKLRAAGVDVTVGDEAMADERAVHGVAQFVSPDGFTHEIYYGHSFMTHSFRPGRSFGGFVAESSGVGHVVLIIPELTDEITQFNRDVLGFDWFGYGMYRGRAEFYRPKLQRRTHSLAYIAVPGRQGLDHIGLEVKELDDVGIAQDLVRDRGLPIHMTMGRHTLDPCISFYSYTPTGAKIEYIWGGAEYPQEQFFETKAARLSLWGHHVEETKSASTVGPAGEEPATVR